MSGGTVVTQSIAVELVVGYGEVDAALSGGSLLNALGPMTVGGTLTGVWVLSSDDLTLDGGADATTLVQRVGTIILPTASPIDAFDATLGT